MVVRAQQDTSRGDVNAWSDQLKRNEKILRRMDHVERFLITKRELEPILTELPGVITVLYQLEGAGFYLNQDYQALAQALDELSLPRQMPPAYICLTGDQMRELAGKSRRTRLIDRPNLPVLTLLFPDVAAGIRSMAVIPLDSGENAFGYLVLASKDARRYRPGLSVDFLHRLGEKVSLHLENGLNTHRLIHLEKQQAVMEMAGAACHEINQPLTVILGLAEMLQNDQLGPEDRRRYLARLLEQAQRLGELTKKISAIRTYKTRDYVQGTRIIDIDGAGAPENNQS
jgi:uncharacterized protein YigA (DUF484 family)